MCLQAFFLNRVVWGPSIDLSIGFGGPNQTSQKMELTSLPESMRAFHILFWRSSFFLRKKRETFFFWTPKNFPRLRFNYKTGRVSNSGDRSCSSSMSLSGNFDWKKKDGVAGKILCTRTKLLVMAAWPAASIAVVKNGTYVLLLDAHVLIVLLDLAWNRWFYLAFRLLLSNENGGTVRGRKPACYG